VPQPSKTAKDIFLLALDAVPSDRSALLDIECGEDVALRRQVEALLRVHDEPGSLLDSPRIAVGIPGVSASGNSSTIDQPLIEKPGSRIGPYKLLQQLGEGGMGVVYMAEQKEPVKRRVALKIIKPGMDTRQVIARFEAERQALAMMDHPSIAKVLDAGATDSGRPYFVMELVNGLPVTQYCDEQHLTPKERLELFVPICQAVQHAHQKGVIHRDLKPSNILVALYDGQPVPKIIDFGVAKATSQTLTEKTMFTQLGQVVGTLEYMSPEQAERNQLDIDTRSDVYSLGVVLYELLTGETPFDKDRLRSAAWDEILRIIREEEPPRPSTRLSSSERLPSIAANRRMEPAKLSALIRGELDWIVIKALEKDRSRRYESAGQLAADVRHFLDDEPVIACPPSSSYRLRRFCRRHWRPVAVATSLLACLILGLAGTIWQARRAMQSESLVKLSLTAEQSARRDEETQRRRAEQSQREAQAALHDSVDRLIRLYLERGLQNIDVSPHVGLPWLSQSLKAGSADAPEREYHRLRIGLMLRELPALIGFWPNAVDAQFSADGTKVAVATGQEALVFELPQMRPIPPMGHDQPVASVNFTRQGDRLATVTGAEGTAHACRIWNSVSGEPESDRLDLSETEYQMRDIPTIHFTPDGERFVAVYAGMYNRWHSKMVTRVFDSRTLQQVSKTFAHHSDLDYIAGYHRLSPDALRVLVPRGVPATDARVTWVNPKFPDDMYRPQQYDLMTADPVHPPLDHGLNFYGMPLYGPKGDYIATSAKGAVKVWDATSGELKRQFSLSSPDADARLQFFPDGKSLIAIEERAAYLWDITTGELKHKWEHEGKFFVDPSGRYRIWRDPNGVDYIEDMSRENPEQRSLPDLDNVTFCPDGSRFVLDPTVHDEAGISVSPPEQIFHSADARPIVPPWRFSQRGQFRQPFTADGRYFLVKDDAGIWLWDLDQRKQLVEEFPPQRTVDVVDAATSQDRRTLVVLTEDRTLTSWNASTGQLLYPPVVIPVPSTSDPESRWKALTLNRAADTVAVLGEYRDPTTEDDRRDVNLVQVWNLKTGRRVFQPLVFNQEPESIVTAVRFVLEDARILIAQYVIAADRGPESAPGVRPGTRLHLVDANTGQAVQEPRDLSSEVRILDLTADLDRCLVMHQTDQSDRGVSDSGTERASVQMLKIGTWEPLTPRMTPRQGVAWNARLNPDGSRLVMGDGEVWDAATGQLLVPAVVTHRRVTKILFQDDGKMFLAVTEGGTSYWESPAEMRLFTLDGLPRSPSMTNSRMNSPDCAIHPINGVIAASGDRLQLWDPRQGAPLSRAIPLYGNGSPGRDGQHDRLTFFTPGGNRLYIEEGVDLLVIHWDEILPDMPNDDVFVAWSGILAGQRIDSTGAVVPMTASDYQSAWNTIRSAQAH
jgi:serine/threonine protein kinase/WD40 repeat protein